MLSDKSGAFYRLLHLPEVGLVEGGTHVPPVPARADAPRTEEVVISPRQRQGRLPVAGPCGRPRLEPRARQRRDVIVRTESLRSPVSDKLIRLGRYTKHFYSFKSFIFVIVRLLFSGPSYTESSRQEF